MSAQESQFDFSSVARPAPSPTPAPAFDFSSVARPAPSARQPRRAVAVEPSAPTPAPAVSTWSLATGAPKVKDWYRQTFNADLPVSSFGLDDYHARRNLDHRNSFDVPLSPSSKEGQALVSYLTSEGIPFRAITAEDVARGVKASGPHIHVGPESHALGSSPMFDFSSVARGPSEYDFSSVAQPAPETEEVVTVNPSIEGATGKPLALDDSRRAYVPDSAEQLPSQPASSLPALRQRESFDVQTMGGRQARDERARAERGPGAYLDSVYPVSDITKVDAGDAVREMYRRAALERGVPPAFFDEWQKRNNPDGYRISDRPGGTELTAADAYDDASKGLRLRLDANHVSRIVDDYQKSKGALEGFSDLATDETHSPVEKLTTLAQGVWNSPSAREARTGVDVGRRTMSAADSYAWARALGYDNTAASSFAALSASDIPNPTQNPAGDIWRAGVDRFAASAEAAARKGDVLAAAAAPQMRDSARVGQIILGMVAQPSNLVPLPAVGELVEAARLGRLTESGGELSAKVMRALRPLGLEEAAEREVADRLTRVLEVTRKLRAGEPLTAEEAALHAEVRAKYAAPQDLLSDADGVRAPAGMSDADSAALREAQERHAYHTERAANAKDPVARANAEALADDYAREVERLQSRGAEPSPEGYDVADAHHSRFQPRTGEGQFDGPPAPLWKRAVSNVTAAVQLPKAKAGFDLSATARQGLAQTLAHPTYFKDAFTNQIKAFASEDAFNAFRAEIMGRADFEQMKDAGLFLSSTGPEAEEVFASKLAQKIPGVRASDRAYSAALDSIRTQAWDSYVSSLPEHLRDNPDTLRAVAELVNISTGRGVVPILDRSALGRKIVNALNVPFFSPRNTASKFNLISPSRIVKNMIDPATRPVAWLQFRDAARGLTVLGTTIGLAHFAGADVGIDPRSSDFGKLRVGHAVYDLTGGESFSVRYLVSMARAFRDMESGKRLKPRETPSALTLHYLRSQLQPASAAAVDLATGKTFEGEPVTKGTIAADLIVPFVVADAYKGWVDAGGSTLTDVGEGKEFKSAVGGASRALPSVVGVGTNFYEKPRKKRR
jgi:hypothetical protein